MDQNDGTAPGGDSNALGRTAASKKDGTKGKKGSTAESKGNDMGTVSQGDASLISQGTMTAQGT